MAKTNKGGIPLFAPFDSLLEGREALYSAISGLKDKHERFEILMVVNRYLSTIQGSLFSTDGARNSFEEQPSDESSFWIRFGADPLSVATVNQGETQPLTVPLSFDGGTQLVKKGK